MSNPSSVGSNFSKHSSSSSKNASSDHPPSPPPTFCITLVPFTLYLLRSSFLKRSLPLTGASTKKRTQRNFSWRLKRMLRIHWLLHSWMPPLGIEESKGLFSQARSPVLQSFLTLRSQTPLTAPLKAFLMALLMALIQGRMKVRKRRWSIKL